MDQRNKLKDTYMPERKTQGELVVVGLSGGIKSMVAASLLKIQKYDLVAVTVVNSWEDFGGDEKSVLSCAFSEEKKEKIKYFCHHLGIPHHFIRAGSEFKEEVVETWMADKVTGVYPDPCLKCHDHRLHLIFQKMKQLGAKHLATGHLAKIYHSDGASVATSNDESHDQSSLLSRLPQEILNALTLPLSDLQLKEVQRLAENFGFQAAPKTINFRQCFPENENIMNYLAKNIPAGLLKGGEMMTVNEGRTFGDIQNLLPFKIGEVVKLSDDKEKNIFARYESAKKKVILAGADYFKRDKILLRECRISGEAPWSAPFKGFYHTGGEDYCEGWVYPKSLDSAYIEFETPAKFVEGETVSITKKKGRNSKVLLTGLVTYLNEVVKDEEQNAKVDHSRDW
jgi:tRNA U34 2-thiouridine synthase MnmA/TrmU